jgi:hypothetical protein
MTTIACVVFLSAFGIAVLDELGKYLNKKDGQKTYEKTAKQCIEIIETDIRQNEFSNNYICNLCHKTHENKLDYMAHLRYCLKYSIIYKVTLYYGYKLKWNCHECGTDLSDAAFYISEGSATMYHIESHFSTCILSSTFKNIDQDKLLKEIKFNVNLSETQLKEYMMLCIRLKIIEKPYQSIFLSAHLTCNEINEMLKNDFVNIEQKINEKQKELDSKVNLDWTKLMDQSNKYNKQYNGKSHYSIFSTGSFVKNEELYKCKYECKKDKSYDSNDSDYSDDSDDEKDINVPFIKSNKLIIPSAPIEEIDYDPPSYQQAIRQSKN